MSRVSIKKIFKNVFGEPLLSRGFVLEKKNGWFMRLVDGDVLQYFRMVETHADKIIRKAFYVEMGLVSLYVKCIDKNTLVWNVQRTYSIAEKNGGPFWYQYEYDPASAEDAELKMQAALREAERLFFPIIDSVMNLNDYVEYCKAYRISVLRGATKFAGNSLALILLNDHDDFHDIFVGELCKEKDILTEDGTFDENNEDYKRLKCFIIDLIPGERDKVFADKELHAAALEEAKRRKEANLQILREMKVIP